MRHICAGTGLAPAHICAGTGLTPPTSAPGPGSPRRPHRLGCGAPQVGFAFPAVVLATWLTSSLLVVYFALRIYSNMAREEVRMDGCTYVCLRGWVRVFAYIYISLGTYMHTHIFRHIY